MTYEASTAALATVDAAPVVLAAYFEPDQSDAAAFERCAKSAATLKKYAGAWLAFASWCEGQGACPLPVSPATLKAYLAHRAIEGAAAASLDVYLAAISHVHTKAGFEAPRKEVRETRKGIRNKIGTAQRRAAPATVEVVRVMAADAGGDLAGARDRALLLVGFAGAFRRSELVAIEVRDLAFSVRGVEVTIRRSKTDQEGRGRTVALPFGSSADSCPVRALRAWLDAAGLVDGPAFRGVDRWGRVGSSLTGRAVADIVKAAAGAAGLDASTFSGHSLRAGLATSAALAGRSDRSIMAQTGHRSRAMVDRYVRAADAWRDNAAAGLL